MAKNTVDWDKNGFLKVVFAGDGQTYQAIMETSALISGLISGWKRENKKKGKEGKLLMLVDITTMRVPEARAITEANKRIQSYGYHKMAVYGPESRVLKEVVNKVVGKLVGGEIKMFKSEQEAVDWLKQYKQ